MERGVFLVARPRLADTVGLTVIHQKLVSNLGGFIEDPIQTELPRELPFKSQGDEGTVGSIRKAHVVVSILRNLVM